MTPADKILHRWRPTDEQRRLLRKIYKRGGESPAGFSRPAGVAATLVRDGLLTYTRPYRVQGYLRGGFFRVVENPKRRCASAPDETHKFRKQFLFFAAQCIANGLWAKGESGQQFVASRLPRSP